MTSANSSPNANAPTPLYWQELIASARRSIGDQSVSESREANHRAISTAYYAAYDALCESNARVLVPQVTDQTGIDAWVRVYRGSSHGLAIRNLKRHLTSLSPDAQNFATTLEYLYEARLSADYNPRSVFKPARRRAFPGPGGSCHRQVRTAAAFGTGCHSHHHAAAGSLTTVARQHGGNH